MRRSFGILSMLIVAAFADAVPASAQTYGDEVNVTIVQVPVVVTRFAKPVSGLKREDFEVYVNGEQQPIAYFDVLDFEPATQVLEGAAPAAPAELSQRRLTLLLFDLAGSSYVNLLRARADIEQLVEAASPNDYIAVATYTGAGHPRYLVPFTRDRAAIMRAVATLERSRASDVLSLAISQGERSAYSTITPSAPSLSMAERQHAEDLEEGVRDFERTISAFQKVHPSTRSGPSMLDRIARDAEWSDLTRTVSWAEALGGVADDLGPLEGIKQVVLFSDGGGLGTVGVLSFASHAARMHARYRAAGAVLNVIDVAGLRAPTGYVSSSHWTPDVLFQASLDTGGTVFHGTGVVNSLRLLAETRSVTYLLGIRPPANERDENEIRVELKGQPMFTDASYRRGYSRNALATSEVNGLLLADIMQNDIRRNDVTVQMKIRSAAPVVVDLGMPADELAAHAVDGALSIDVFTYVFDGSNTAAAWKHRRMKLDAGKMRAELGGRHFVVREQFDLPQGRYAIKTLVHVVGRERIGFARRDIDVVAR